MHELSLTEKLLKLVLAEAEAHQAKQITKIKIAIGDLSGIVEGSVETYFRLIAEPTIAAQAVLEFTRVRANLFCSYCNHEFIKPASDFLCPDCGELGRLTDSGRECFVESIEVE